jgi:hypothetical protein
MPNTRNMPVRPTSEEVADEKKRKVGALVAGMPAVELRIKALQKRTKISKDKHAAEQDAVEENFRATMRKRDAEMAERQQIVADKKLEDQRQAAQARADLQRDFAQRKADALQAAQAARDRDEALVSTAKANERAAQHQVGRSEARDVAKRARGAAAGAEDSKQTTTNQNNLALATPRPPRKQPPPLTAKRAPPNAAPRVRSNQVGAPAPQVPSFGRAHIPMEAARSELVRGGPRGGTARLTVASPPRQPAFDPAPSGRGGLRSAVAQGAASGREIVENVTFTADDPMMAAQMQAKKCPRPKPPTRHPPNPTYPQPNTP